MTSAYTAKRSCKINVTAETELKSATVKLHQRVQSPTLLRESCFERRLSKKRLDLAAMISCFTVKSYNIGTTSSYK